MGDDLGMLFFHVCGHPIVGNRLWPTTSLGVPILRDNPLWLGGVLRIPTSRFPKGGWERIVPYNLRPYWGGTRDGDGSPSVVDTSLVTLGKYIL